MPENPELTLMNSQTEGPKEAIVLLWLFSTFCNLPYEQNSLGFGKSEYSHCFGNSVVQLNTETTNNSW